jgi:hypothetical protein
MEITAPAATTSQCPSQCLAQTQDLIKRMTAFNRGVAAESDCRSTSTILHNMGQHQAQIFNRERSEQVIVF